MDRPPTLGVVIFVLIVTMLVVSDSSQGWTLVAFAMERHERWLMDA